jgi:DNA-damage-inducible protein D
MEPTNDAALVPGEEIFDGVIRHVWHDDRWFFSVIDVIATITESSNARNYWNVLKSRLQDEGAAETYTKCVQLKMPAKDGKQRLTDAADAETILRIVQTIPSPKAEPVKQWLARVGAERIAETEQPELAADRIAQLYRQRGYPEEWIEQWLKNIVVRDELTEEWKDRGARAGREFATLTDTIHIGTFDVNVVRHKEIKSLHARQNLRDSMTRLELAILNLAEVTATEMHRLRDSQQFNALQRDARDAGTAGRTARLGVEEQIGRPVVSAENYKSLTTRQPRLIEDVE